MKPRYIVNVVLKVISVYDTKENREICGCTFLTDANRIAKAMNMSDSWEPMTKKELEDIGILSLSEDVRMERKVK